MGAREGIKCGVNDVLMMLENVGQFMGIDRFSTGRTEKEIFRSE